MSEIQYTSYLPTRGSSFSETVWVDEDTRRFYFNTPQGVILGYETHNESVFQDILDKVLTISSVHGGSGLGRLYNQEIKGRNSWIAVVHEYASDVTMVFDPKFDVPRPPNGVVSGDGVMVAGPATLEAEDSDTLTEEGSYREYSSVTIVLSGKVDADNHSLANLVQEFSAVLETYAGHLDLRIKGVNTD